MIPRWLALAGAALLGCSAPHARIDVPLAAGPDADEPILRAVEEAVAGDAGRARDDVDHRAGLGPASATDGLVCSRWSGGVLLRCTPGSVGSQGGTVTVTVSRAPGGLRVEITQAWAMPGRTPAVCALQRRVAAAIAGVAPGAAAVHADGC